MRTNTIMPAAASLALLFAVSSLAQEGGTPPQDPRLELKERLKERNGAIERLRDAEKVGETDAGLTDVVKPAYGQDKADPADPKSPTIAALLEAENKDRKALYELLAKDLKVTPEEVGKQKGIRSLEKAKYTHWVKLDGRWVQKKDVHAKKKESEKESVNEKKK